MAKAYSIRIENSSGFNGYEDLLLNIKRNNISTKHGKMSFVNWIKNQVIEVAKKNSEHLLNDIVTRMPGYRTTGGGLINSVRVIIRDRKVTPEGHSFEVSLLDLSSLNKKKAKGSDRYYWEIQETGGRPWKMNLNPNTFKKMRAWFFSHLSEINARKLPPSQYRNQPQYETNSVVTGVDRYGFIRRRKIKQRVVWFNRGIAAKDFIKENMNRLYNDVNKQLSGDISERYVKYLNRPKTKQEK